jgi:hypothetical protein
LKLCKSELSILLHRIGAVEMEEINVEEAKKKASDMIIEGISFDEIMNETRLRLKDLKRIQRDIAEKL